MHAGRGGGGKGGSEVDIGPVAAGTLSDGREMVMLAPPGKFDGVLEAVGAIENAVAIACRAWV
jgi:hypothetical protein